ncbi:hypothetical protein PGT21_008002 [Puccinia graminis f. sp. tritici]|uniref:Uncharacterized protein n=1 Tax=Puccinia graminis f. sp. tritici TaxID=56615 RepID=A0A5B0LYS8_PUCGR|nr:hypothetical protein PGT21_008002 [Puccinia graminis f. sp. tritici]
MPSTPRTPRRTRTRTRTRRPIAYSSQHIIAVATNNRTIQLRFIPNPNRPTPANEYQLSKQEEHPLRIEELLFSPDGTQLLIISISPARLRLSILNQSPDKADQWNLAWDYLIRTKQPTKISAATFINQTRRLFIIHLPPAESNLPPHTLLTSLDHSVESLKLIPTPSSDISIEHNNLPTEDGLGSSHPTPTNATTTTTETLKEIRIAAIGTPPSRRRQSPNEPESQPSLLIAFQSQTRPGVPRPIKQTVIPTNTTDHRAKQTTDDFAHHQLGGGARFPLGEDEELGDYITGIGDLDDAFDGPSVQPQSTNLSTDHNPDHPDVTKSSNEQADQPPKPSLESHKQDLNLRLRRFEPVPPSDHFSSLISPFLDHLPHQPSFGFIDLIELLIDFDHSIIPNVTIHLIPSLPITDPFDHTTDSQVILRHLSFVTSQSSDATDSKTKEDSFRLLASFSRQETYEEGIATVIEQLQAWDVRFQLSSLSTGFLSLESINDLRNHSIDPSSSAPTDLLRGPVEWVFNRVGHRKLLIDKESSSSSTEPIEHRSSSLIRVCKLIPQWRVREGCFLVFVEKRKRPIGLFKAADPLEGSEGVDDEDEQGEGEGDEGVEYECWVLDGHDLSTLAVKALPRLDQGELEQVSLSYHGIWACTLDQHGKVRASPLVSLDQPATIIGLIISALHNREPVDDISRLLATPSTSAIESTPTSTERSPINGVVTTHHPIFRDIGLFITHLYPPCRGFDFDPYLASSWSLSYDLWSVVRGYEKAAEIALIGRQLLAVLGIGTMVKADGFPGSVWQMIGLSRWYLKLTQRIIGSIDPDSETPHLCLIAMSGCSFYFLFKVAMVVSGFHTWLKVASSSATTTPGGHPLHPHQRRPSQPVHPSSIPLDNFTPARPEDQVEIAWLVFAEFWEHQNFIHMETFGKLLQDIGRTVFPKQTVDLSTLATRHIQGYTLAMTALDSAQVQESVRELREYVGRHPALIKPGSISESSESISVPPSATLRPSTPPNGPSTTPTTTPSSVPAPSATLPGPPPTTTTGAEWLSSAKTIATLKKINRTIKPDDDLAKYDLLSGVKLADATRASKRTHQGTPIIHRSTELEKSVKECIKCRARALVHPWTYNDLLSSSSSSSSPPGNPLGPSPSHPSLDTYLSRLTAFDFSIKEFKRRCFCSGFWVSPSSSSFE